MKDKHDVLHLIHGNHVMLVMLAQMRDSMENI